jgi:hypothetical protein
MINHQWHNMERQKSFDEMYDRIVEELRGNLTNEEYRELVTIEYSISQGYDKPVDSERYWELRERK